jgi:hypothetical protein
MRLEGDWHARSVNEIQYSIFEEVIRPEREKSYMLKSISQHQGELGLQK